MKKDGKGKTLQNIISFDEISNELLEEAKTYGL
jgi:hypothetical protein